MKDCTTCDKKPTPGSKYEDTACASCVLDEPMRERGRITYNDSFDVPSLDTWRAKSIPSITEQSRPAGGLALYMRMEPDERMAIRRFVTVITLSTEQYLVDKMASPETMDSEVARKRGTSRQAASKRTAHINSEIEEWFLYEQERAKRDGK